MLKVVPTAAKSDVRYQLYEKGGMPWSQIGGTQYHAKLGLQTKVVQSKGWLSAIIGI